MTLGIELVGGDGHLGEVTSARTRCLSRDTRGRGHERTGAKGKAKWGGEGSTGGGYRRLREDRGGEEGT